MKLKPIFFLENHGHTFAENATILPFAETRWILSSSKFFLRLKITWILGILGLYWIILDSGSDKGKDSLIFAK